MNDLIVGVVGNPNSGKSTLFNQLTGARQKVGNWPGVTIECKSGYFQYQKFKIDIVDLPGIYQLSCSDSLQALDEKIACDFILGQGANLIVNIVDAAHLERHLYLTLQLIAMKMPLIVVVNMMDVAKRRRIELDLEKLQTLLGCQVVPMIANKGSGLNELRQRIITCPQADPKLSLCPYPRSLEVGISILVEQINIHQPEFNFCAEWLALQLLQEMAVNEKIKPHLKEVASRLKLEIEQENKEEIDILIADAFYSAAHDIAKEVISKQKPAENLSDKIDKVVLNRWLGLPIFLGIMYAMFLFAINLGGAFQDFFDIGSETIFVQGLSQLFNYFHAPSLVIALLAAGLGKGINTTISFIPVIGAMFFFLSFLEASGYMARASFVLDRIMRLVGLPGKSFIPMIVGFGCNVPAILAARTLETPRDRILTVLMTPFMSCGARLAIFAVFTAAFFPTGGQNIVFALYFIGILAAILTGLILRKTFLTGKVSPLVLELPAYHWPSSKALINQTWLRLKSFIFRAGKLIVPVCMLIGVLNAINVDGTLNHKESSSNSILSSVGRVVTPVLAPMGIRQENWPATVGLVTGILAKEVVVATLNTLYAQQAHISEQEDSKSLSQGIESAFLSIPRNLIALKDSFSNPIHASAPIDNLNKKVDGVMYKNFGGKAAAFAYLLFVLLYFPCVSATAVMAKEINKRWTFFSVAWSTGIAYATATCFYQAVTFNQHPKQSFIWMAAIIISLTYLLSILKGYSSKTPCNEVKVCC